MTNRERRDRGLAYLADEDLLAEMSACKRRLKKVNDLDPWDYEKIVEAEKKVIPHSQDLYLVPRFTVITARISHWESISRRM